MDLSCSNLKENCHTRATALLFWLLSSSQGIEFIYSKMYISNIVYPSVFVMELWADKSKLIGNLDLPTAITAFIQLCFVFNLRYPAVWTSLHK